MTRRETWAAGQLIESADLPDPVPEAITPVQCRLALLDAGLLDAIHAYIVQQPEPVRLRWEYATEIRRDDPTLLACAAALGLTAQQVDALFVAAGG